MTLPQPAWSTVPLRELVAEVRLKVDPKEADGLPFVGMDHIESQSMRLLGTVPAATMRSAAVRFEPGDVLYGRLRPYLNKVHRTESRGLGSAEFLVLTPAPAVDADYLSLVLNSGSFVRFASRLNTGDRPRVTFDQIGGYPVPLPPLKEQRRIAWEVHQQLSRLHAAQGDLKRVLPSIAILRTAVAAAATSGKLVPPEAELGLPYEAAAELVRRMVAEGRSRRERRNSIEAADPSSKALPAGWAWARLRDLGELDRGISKHRPRNAPALYGGPYPFIQTGDIRRSDGTIRTHSQSYNEVGLAQSRLWPAGTLCITIAANIAETAVLTYPACFPDSVAGFIHPGETATTRYVQLCFYAMKQRLWELAPATAQKNINLRTLDAILIPLPPLKEQRRIVEEAEKLFSLAQSAETIALATLSRSKQLRGSLLGTAIHRLPAVSK